MASLVSRKQRPHKASRTAGGAAAVARIFTERFVRRRRRVAAPRPGGSRRAGPSRRLAPRCKALAEPQRTTYGLVTTTRGGGGGLQHAQSAAVSNPARAPAWAALSQCSRAGAPAARLGLPQTPVRARLRARGRPAAQRRGGAAAAAAGPQAAAPGRACAPSRAARIQRRTSFLSPDDSESSLQYYDTSASSTCNLVVT
jgi:hypothetical protein